MEKNSLLKKISRSSIVLSLSIFFVTSVSGNINPVIATEEEQYIGTILTIEHVTQTTKVYVIGSLLDLAQQYGRTIYQEINSPLNDCANATIDCVFMDNGYYEGTREFQPPVRYYYFANSLEPIITGSRAMYNDYESLIFALQYLEAEALYFGETDVGNSVLSYIRNINNSYRTNHVSSFFGDVYYYNIVCGQEHLSLVNNIKQIYPGGMRINEYFAAFLNDDELYDSNIYGTCNPYYLSLNLELINPSSNNVHHTIDLIHMFASMDGIFTNTEEATGDFPFNLLEKNTYRHLVSWAGDLQSCTKICANSSFAPSSFQLILASSYYGFDYSDFYADLDAINIAMGNSVNSNSISYYVNNYFTSLSTNSTDRYTLFLNKIAGTVNNSSYTTNEKFVYKIKEMLGISLTNDNIINILDPAHTYLKYRILSTDTELNYRITIAERFIEYVLSQ